MIVNDNSHDSSGGRSGNNSNSTEKENKRIELMMIIQIVAGRKMAQQC